MKHFSFVKITGMVTVRNSEVISGIFDGVRICCRGNYA